MNYIVFDLEWNQSPGGKKYSNSRLPFEIIEYERRKRDGRCLSETDKTTGI